MVLRVTRFESSFAGTDSSSEVFSVADAEGIQPRSLLLSQSQTKMWA